MSGAAALMDLRSSLTDASADALYAVWLLLRRAEHHEPDPDVREILAALVESLNEAYEEQAA